MDFYGLTERFDEFVSMAGNALGLTNLSVTRCNETSYLPDNGTKLLKRDDLPAEELATLSEMLADDLWFYKRAKKFYEIRRSNMIARDMLCTPSPLSAELMPAALKSIHK